MEPGKTKKSGGWVPVIVRGNEAGQDTSGEDDSEPDWILLSDLCRRPDPLFRNVLFLEGDDDLWNVYILVGDYLTVVDPGNDHGAFTQLFKHPEYAPEDIRKIVLTNGRPDNAMGTVELFRYRSIRSNPELEVIVHAEGPREFKTILRRFGSRVTEVHGGETLDLGGFAWSVIHTPGHRPESICLHHAPTRTLISGDVSSPLEAAVPDELAGERTSRFLASMRFLLRHEIENILPGHGLPAVSAGGKVIERAYLAALAGVVLSGREQVPSFLDAASAAAEAGLMEDAEFCRRMAPAADNESGPSCRRRPGCRAPDLPSGRRLWPA